MYGCTSQENHDVASSPPAPTSINTMVDWSADGMRVKGVQLGCETHMASKRFSNAVPFIDISGNYPGTTVVGSRLVWYRC